MRTLNNYQPIPPLEMACNTPSQIEPDGATSLRDVVAQYMAGITPHQVSSCYFDFDGAMSGIPDLDTLPQIPDFATIEEVQSYIDNLKSINDEINNHPPESNLGHHQNISGDDTAANKQTTVEQQQQ